MAYTDDAVKAKLSALNETQEGIVTVAQWVMFHRRHAERTAQLWLQKLRDSPAPKRLNLIYLANEVAQQSRARRKEDFLIAFSPIIAEATATAYKGASNDIQQKLRRVVEVWRQRSIFEIPIQDAVEARVDEIDKSRSTGKKPPLGGSLFSSSSGSTPSELQPLVPLQVALSKTTVASGASATTANAEYDKMHDPNTPLPTPPVHAARLSQLLKALANAESSVSEVIKSRLALIDGLEKLLETNRSALSKEQTLTAQLSERRSETEAKKREVEDGIMRGLSAENSPAANLGDTGVEGEPVLRPEVEALTPPPVEALTPVGSPKQEPQETDFVAQNHSHVLPTGFTLPGFGYPTEAAQNGLQDDPNGLHAKRRKVIHEEEDYAQFAGGDLDADVAELLQQESNLSK
ncbi:RNA polymerase II-binding domain-containing protein [Aspergillus coremiiformis]|uniref:RNA polymerase II-binding domain-containing protein n=1 Tax=Aspergillus coremiiformis TaxID=138285 RepID=A0A5N6YXX9_9EURO|nr:RNA polymerase II-binding domain-containing protein [Aspergillus coremiiformis]